MYIATIAFLLLSFLFLILAAYTNPSIIDFVAKINGIKPNPQIEYGSFASFIPLMSNSTSVDYFVRMNFTLSGKDLSVGQPILMRVNASIQGPLSFHILGMSIELMNTFQSGTPYAPIKADCQRSVEPLKT